MSINRFSNLLITLFFILPASLHAQNDICANFNKVILMMDNGFISAKGNKIIESTKDYTSMIITTKKWLSTYLFPGSLSADITDMLRVAPDPRNAGHNLYITFNFAKNSTRAIAETIFNKMKEMFKLCIPENWKVEDRTGKTYARFSLMNGNDYDNSPRKITLQFSKLEGPGERYTADLIFDSAVK